jgi:hypothetical protein
MRAWQQIEEQGRWPTVRRCAVRPRRLASAERTQPPRRGPLALELSYRHIDTAQAYGNEESVGQGPREKQDPCAISCSSLPRSIPEGEAWSKRLSAA